MTHPVTPGPSTATHCATDLKPRSDPRSLTYKYHGEGSVRLPFVTYSYHTKVRTLPYGAYFLPEEAEQPLPPLASKCARLQLLIASSMVQVPSPVTTVRFHCAIPLRPFHSRV